MLNPKELKETLRSLILNNQEIQNEGHIPISIDIQGIAGSAKTSVVEQLAEEMNLDFVKLNLAEFEDTGDLCGMPVKEFLMCDPKKGEEDCIWVTEATVDSYRDLGFRSMNQSRMSYAAPDWAVGKREGGILLLDDSNRA